MNHESADIRLIDQAAAVAGSFGDGWDAPLRRTPTQLLLQRNLKPEAALWIDSEKEALHITGYPIQPVPEERLLEMAEFLNLIAATGVPFKFGLDVAHGVVRLGNWVSFADTHLDPTPLMSDLFGKVFGAVLFYRPSLHRVAFEGAAPPTELAELERQYDLFVETDGASDMPESRAAAVWDGHDPQHDGHPRRVRFSPLAWKKRK